MTILAWVVVFIAAVGATLLLNKLIRFSDDGLLKKLICFLTFTFFLTPAPVPLYAESWAPAFVIAVFEFFFQAQGSPSESAGILLASLVVVSAIVSAMHIWGRKRKI